MIRIRHSNPCLPSQLLERRGQLMDKSAQRRAKLENSYRLQAFERDSDETKGWINEKLKFANDESYLVGPRGQRCEASGAGMGWGCESIGSVIVALVFGTRGPLGRRGLVVQQGE